MLAASHAASWQSLFRGCASWQWRGFPRHPLTLCSLTQPARVRHQTRSLSTRYSSCMFARARASASGTSEHARGARDARAPPSRSASPPPAPSNGQDFPERSCCATARYSSVSPPSLPLKSRNVLPSTSCPLYIVLFYFSCRLPARLLFAYPRPRRCTAAPHHA